MLRLVLFASILILAMFSGCSMCCERWYETYGGYGGSWERVDPQRGRVGSAFSDAGVRVGTSGDSGEPEPVVEPQLPAPPTAGPKS